MPSTGDRRSVSRVKFQDVPSHGVGVVQDCYSCSHASICMFNGFGSKQVPHVLVHHKCRSLSVETESGDTTLGS